MAANGYPKISAKAWRKLRAKAAAAPTTKFTPAGVAAIMSMASPDSARNNIVTPMRKLGLIDDDGALTDVGNRWSVDASYEQACGEILRSVYPEELASLTGDDGGPDPKQVKTWFDHKGFGESNSQNMASTYILIAGKAVPEPPSSEPVKKQATKKAKRPAVEPAAKQASPAVQPPPPILSFTPMNQDGPSLHIDIQIHLPADADSEQIERIFASMAKHLYPQQTGE